MQGGIVKTSAQPKALTYTPDGWQDLAIGWERNMQRVGTVRNFTVPLGFVMDGAQILRHLLYTQNIEKKVYLLIQKLEYEEVNGKYQFIYRYFYRGELDLKTLEDGDSKVTVSIAEGGLAKMVKANEGTVNEYDLVESVRVKMDGIFLYESGSFLVPDMELENKNFLGNVVLPVSFLNKEGESSGVAYFTQSLDSTNNGTTYAASSENYALAVAESQEGDIAFDITGAIRFTVTANPIGGVFVGYCRTSLGRTPPGVSTPQPQPASNTYEVTYNIQNFTMSPGEKLFFFASYGSVSVPSAIGMKINILENAQLKVTYKNRYRTTFVKAYLPTTLYELLTESVTGKRANALSTLLEANKNLAITCGDAIRGIEGAKVKTSLTQFLDTFRVILAAGFGIENQKLRLEAFSHFLDESNPVYLGEAKDLKVNRTTDLFANTLKVGYNEKSIDDVNGKAEFNNTHLYSSPITSLAKELTLISPYNAQPYAIELARINLAGKTTTDNSSDNEVFLLNIDYDNPQTDADGIYYNLKRGDFLFTVTGVPDPATIFNVLDLTPKRIAYKHQSWLNSIFQGFQGEKLPFKTTEKNSAVITYLGNEVITEKADILIGSSRLFLPYYVEFDIQVPVNLVEILEANPNTCFSFSWNGKIEKGFLIKAAIAPNTNKEQSFKLLLAPSTNLNHFL